jgi:hypothetical protein
VKVLPPVLVLVTTPIDATIFGTKIFGFSKVLDTFASPPDPGEIKMDVTRQEAIKSGLMLTVIVTSSEFANCSLLTPVCCQLSTGVNINAMQQPSE